MELLTFPYFPTPSWNEWILVLDIRIFGPGSKAGIVRLFFDQIFRQVLLISFFTPKYNVQVYQVIILRGKKRRTIFTCYFLYLFIFFFPALSPPADSGGGFFWGVLGGPRI